MRGILLALLLLPALALASSTYPSDDLIIFRGGILDGGGRVFDVRAFGAVCNVNKVGFFNAANDTTKIQKAIDKAASLGGGVVTGTGNCKVTFSTVTGIGFDALQLKSGVSLVGNGRDWTLSADTQSLVSTGHTVVAIGTDAVPSTRNKVIGLVIDGQSTSPPDASDYAFGVAMHGGTDDLEVAFNEIKNLRGDAVDHGQIQGGATQANRVNIHHNQFHHLVGQGVSSGNSSGIQTETDWNIESNTFYACTNPTTQAAEAIIVSSGGNKFKIVNNTVYAYGAILFGSSQTLVRGNYVQTGTGSSQAGIFCKEDLPASFPADDVQIIDNEVDESGSTTVLGVIVDASVNGARHLIRGNIVKRNSGAGQGAGILRSTNGATAAAYSDVTIDHNTIWNGHAGAATTDTPDIYVTFVTSGTTRRIIVDHNICGSSTQAITVDAGSDHVEIDGNETTDGGIMVRNATDPVIQDNTIYTTHPTFAQADAGAITIHDGDRCKVQNNKIDNNQSGAIGIRLRRTAGTLTNCTVSGNTIRLQGGGAPAALQEVGTVSNNQWLDNIFLGSGFSATFTGTPILRDSAGIAKAALDALTLGNGSTAYCTDCNIVSPCTAAGTGAWYKIINGVKVCN